MTDASAVPPPLERGTRVAASRDAVSADLDGETVILGLHDGIYYGLDRVGCRIWALVGAPITLAEIHAHIVAEYAVAPEVAWDDLVALVADLLSSGLLDRVTE